MTKSMTAYGRFSFSLKKYKFTFEIHSLNRKGLDLSIYLPKEMFFLDIEIRKWVKPIASRGQVTVRLTKDFSSDDIDSILPEQDRLQQLKDGWSKLSKGLGYRDSEIPLTFLTDQYEKLCRVDENGISEHVGDLKKAFEKTAEQFMQMKHMEGAALKDDIEGRIKVIRELKQKILELTKTEPEDYKAKLEQKIARFESVCSDNEEKIAREVVIFSDKVDVSEELSRLDSHITQFSKRFDSDEQSIGKTLDFLVLEMIRETNTTLAKTSLIEVTNTALAIKGELEKIREQVQNIE